MSPIDPFLFEQHFRAFVAFVEGETGEPLASLQTHPYLDKHENYKKTLHAVERERLGWRDWGEEQVGSGQIVRSVIRAIEIEHGGARPRHNLMPWEGPWGPESRPHRALHEALDEGDRERVERAFFDLYRSRVDDATSFGRLVDLFGRQYALLAYLFFLKDRTAYVPSSTGAFDAAFERLGVGVRTAGRASWKNYAEYNRALQDLRHALADRLGAETTLLDAHSFAWTLEKAVCRRRKGAAAPASIEASQRSAEYAALPPKEREAVAKARVGQGPFRSDLLDYWGACAVTGCAEGALLRASHIKPWRDCDVQEARDPYNGLLLSAALDAAFGALLITFDDGGRLLVSPRLSREDAEAVGIREGLALRRPSEPAHRPYLSLHRERFLRAGAQPLHRHP